MSKQCSVDGNFHPGIFPLWRRFPPCPLSPCSPRWAGETNIRLSSWKALRRVTEISAAIIGSGSRPLPPCRDLEVGRDIRDPLDTSRDGARNTLGTDYSLQHRTHGFPDTDSKYVICIPRQDGTGCRELSLNSWKAFLSPSALRGSDLVCTVREKENRGRWYPVKSPAQMNNEARIPTAKRN